MPLRVLCTSAENAIKELVSLTKAATLLDGLMAIEYAEHLVSLKIAPTLSAGVYFALAGRLSYSALRASP